ncbi:MAG: gliding motility-associated C-terminal domain-containing protein [Flavobacteriales bacterium]
MARVVCFWILLLCAHSFGWSQAIIRENKGQWPDEVFGMLRASAADFWIEESSLLVQCFDANSLSKLHPKGQSDAHDDRWLEHRYRTIFNQALPGEWIGLHHTPDLANYFHSSDPRRWAVNCRGFKQFQREGIYEQIDLLLYANEQHVKYDFILHPGSNPSNISYTVEGADVQLKSGVIHIQTQVGFIQELKPFAYQLVNGVMQEVPCSYRLNGNTISFDLGSYDADFTLIIDPEIAFSTYIGSPASNFGFTACDDSQGNLISGAAVFAANYPTTTGAYSSSFNTGAGNYMDVALSKFSPDGTQLLYSTYIGGAGQETPHSLIADDQDNFIVFGVTGSSEYPTTAGAYQSNFIGGPSLPMNTFFTSSHPNGTDLFISKFSANGALLQSTFVGGTDNDGLNYADQLFYNYGDAFRGEVNVDAQGNIYIASVTRSVDFPVVGAAAAPQNSFGGGECDGIICKLNASLSSMIWSTYVGGAGNDACYSIELMNTGEILIAGGTQSPNFPFISSPSNTLNWQGETDGFITKLNGANLQLSAGTFCGTGAYDQVYFLQTDNSNNIYAYGQTAGDMAISPGIYGQANSGQFVRKYSPALDNLLWSTTIGTGSGEIDISPTAFLVSECEQIYISGWGGEVNANFCNFAPCYAESSTTLNLPTTNDAYQSTTDGSDFYLCVLSPDASGLLYASFLGGPISREHVDGGTSRFDKNGSVFQAVCAGCQNNDDFPTTPSAWSATNESTGCNIAVFRFDLNAIQTEIALDGPPQICLNESLSLQNLSTGATSYHWYFGDGEESSLFEPNHAYTQPGEYTIQLIGLDATQCVDGDTASIQIEVIPDVNPSISNDTTICAGSQAVLLASGTSNLHWLPQTGINNVSNPQQTVQPNNTTTYQVVDENLCDADTLAVTVTVSAPNVIAGPDVSICIGQSTEISATGNGTVVWSPATNLANANAVVTSCSAIVTTTYHITLTNADGCIDEDSLEVFVFDDSPGGLIYDPLTICFSESATLNAAPGTGWLWSPAIGLSNTQVQSPIASPPDSTMYTVQVTNACGTGTDTVWINVIHPLVTASEGGAICVGDSISATAIGAQEYWWSPSLYASPSNASQTQLSPAQTTWFVVTGQDEFNCIDQDSVLVTVYPIAAVDAGPNQYFTYPGTAQLLGNAMGFPFYWWPAEGLSCTDCIYPEASPQQSTWYHLAVLDDNGCVSDDSVLVVPYFPVWVPNVFTPNRDGINDVFKAEGLNIRGFHLMVFDRWGLLVFESHNIDEAWTGNFRGGEYYVADDVYDWIIEYDSIDRREQLRGHVTLVR